MTFTLLNLTVVLHQFDSIKEYVNHLDIHEFNELCKKYDNMLAFSESCKHNRLKIDILSHIAIYSCGNYETETIMSMFLVMFSKTNICILIQTFICDLMVRIKGRQDCMQKVHSSMIEGLTKAFYYEATHNMNCSHVLYSPFYTHPSYFHRISNIQSINAVTLKIN